MSDQEFSSNKPYLFRAIYEWLLDNEATPYILVDATRPEVDVPREHIKDNQIVLNVNPSAVQQWHADNQAISFSARFSGVARKIYVPMNALMAVYAQENGLGMAFPVDEDLELQSESEAELPGQSEPELSLAETDVKNQDDQVASSKVKKKSSTKDKGSHLKVVK